MPKPTPLVLAAAALLPAVILTGCHKTGTVRSSQTLASPNAIDFNRINTDGKVNKAALVESVYESNVDGLRRVQLNLVNRQGGTFGSNKTRGVRWKAAWYDTNGLEIPSGTDGWKTVFLDSGSAETLTFTAPTPDAADWRINLQPWNGK